MLTYIHTYILPTTLQVDIATGKVLDILKFEIGKLAMITKGRNTGRVGTLLSVEKHPGSFDIVHVRDAENNVFATREGNIFTIGKGADVKNLQISLPRGKGIARTIFEQRDMRMKKA